MFKKTMLCIFVLILCMLLGSCSADAGREQPSSALSESSESTSETSAGESTESEQTGYVSPVSGTSGLLTLKNFLATAMEPAGVTLYVYGGGWNLEDTGSSEQAVSIGLPETWLDFFESQDASYSYEDYYPVGGQNRYYYAGADCSGFVGWAVYNLINTENGNSGYVCKFGEMAASLADAGYGTVSTDVSDIRPGDIVSIDGHVWISLGRCSDGSIVILHSTPSESVSGGKGGGVQLSALNPSSDSNENCEAYALADKYMSEYYPDWSERYSAELKSYSLYTTFDSGNSQGIFHWDTENFLTDPEGFLEMTAEEILKELFGE